MSVDPTAPAAGTPAGPTRAEPGIARPELTRLVDPARSEGGGSRGNHGFRRAGGVGRLNEPRPALVEAGFGEVPARVNRQEVALVREEWRVVDRWWTEEPISRRYFDVVLESGQNAVVFRDEEKGGWWSQKA